MKNKILIIDYGMGNVHSLISALKFINCDVILSRDYNEISKIKKIILPGVGAYDKAMENIKKYNLQEALIDFAQNKENSILGICLGMQILATTGEENRNSLGLNLISGNVKKFKPIKEDTPIPHIGYNEIEINNKVKNRSFNSFNKKDFYFVHSYHFDTTNKDDTLSTSSYGGLDFSSMILKNNILGVQFHPEKSQSNGLKLLKLFSDFQISKMSC